MPILTAGSNITLSLGDNSIVTVQTRGTVDVDVISGLGLTAGRIAEISTNQAFGPYSVGGQLKLTASDRDCYYEVASSAKTRSTAPVVLAQSGVASSVTGTTAETTLASITIPGGMMGPNGSVRLRLLFSTTNSANGKTLSAKFGGQTVYSTSVTTSAQANFDLRFSNRNSVTSQVANGTPNATSTVPVNALTINTAVDQIVTVSGQLANAGETITLESYSVEVLPA